MKKIFFLISINLLFSFWVKTFDLPKASPISDDSKLSENRAYERYCERMKWQLPHWYHFIENDDLEGLIAQVAEQRAIPFEILRREYYFDEQTLLHWAVRYNNCAALRVFLGLPLDENLAKSENGLLVIRDWNALLKSPNSIAALLACERDKNIKLVDRLDNTILHMAVLYDASIQCIQTLVDAGIDLNALNDPNKKVSKKNGLNNLSNFDCRMQYGKKQLFDHPRYSALCLAVTSKKNEAAKFLIKLGAGRASSLKPEDLDRLTALLDECNESVRCVVAGYMSEQDRSLVPISSILFNFLSFKVPLIGDITGNLKLN